MLLKSVLGNTPAGKSFRPEGWMKRQLEIQAAGLAGNLDRMWRDVKESAWIGGTAEGWERVPYWLDGFIDLAWLLDDEGMQQRAKRYIDSILAQQKEDGWICPCPEDKRGEYDMWSLFLIGKVLVVWEHRTGDERVYPALYRAFRQLCSHLKEFPLFDWGKARWFEGMIGTAFLYERCREPWLLELVEMLHDQGIDLPEKVRSWRWTTKEKDWTLEAHVVNLAMQIHGEFLYQIMVDGDIAKGAECGRALLETLNKYHGTAYGHFTGDECLAGDSPVQGTELCGIVESMFSAELLLAGTGDTRWGTYLENLAYNALPAGCSEDMWTHQYDQQTNQIACVKSEKAVWSTNGGDANRFGLEPHYGCCTANFGQGWPKLAANTFLLKDDVVTVALLLPGSLKTALNGAEVLVKDETEYPFKDKGVLTVEAPEAGAEFTLKIRIPDFARHAVIDGVTVEAGSYWECRKVWKGTQTIAWQLVLETELIQRPNGLKAVRRGALLYSLPIASQKERVEYVRNGVERKFPYCDYDIAPTEKWGYGFAGENFVFEEGTIGEYPFSESEPPCQINADMLPVEWETLPELSNVAQPFPEKIVPAGEAVRKRLIPYGCTTLRMTEMPLVK